MSQFLTKKDVAIRLGVSLGTVENMIRRGDIPTPGSDAGNRVLWLKKVIDDWLEDHDPDPYGLMSLAEVAALLRVSRSTINRMRARGQLPQPIRVGGQLRWRPQDLQEWLSTS